MAQRVERWTCDQQVMARGFKPDSGQKLRNNLGQVVHTLCASVTKQYNLVLAKGQ